MTDGEGTVVRNRAALLENGDREGREFLLGVVGDALGTLRPDRLLEDVVCRNGSTLRVGGVDHDLDAAGAVSLLAVGKGSTAFADALGDRIGDRLGDALVVGKEPPDDREGMRVLEAAHPVPDRTSRRAGRAVLGFADRAGESDLVFVVVTGGTSALLAAPPEGVSVGDQAAVTDRLLRAGAPIEDLNAVRKHLSRLKGGRLAERLHPATVVTLVVVDEVAGEPWGPTVPDGTTPADAVDALRTHGQWERAPAGVRDHLRRVAEAEGADTPTSLPPSTRTVVLADGSDACEAAAGASRERGVEATILSTTVEGESREVGRALASVAAEVAAAGRPLEPPCLLVSGGETTVTVTGDAGEGGPNQEFALACAERIAGHGIAAVALDTDGTDGPTGIAGGIVDGRTAERARGEGVDLAARLREHDASGALRALGDAVRLEGGTNLMDLELFYVRE